MKMTLLHLSRLIPVPIIDYHPEGCWVTSTSNQDKRLSMMTYRLCTIIQIAKEQEKTGFIYAL